VNAFFHPVHRFFASKIHHVTLFSGFGSCVWRIRNSSTLLFSALMTRIFGVKKEKDLETSGKNRFVVLICLEYEINSISHFIDR